MPSLFASYLRVYEPLTAFDRERQVFWRRYVREGRAVAPLEGPVRQRTAVIEALGAGWTRLPDLPEEAYVLEADDTLLVCPWNLRLRVAEAALNARDGVPSVIADAFVPPVLAGQARAVVDDWRSGARVLEHGVPRVHEQIATWGVPLRWFVFVDLGERDLVIRTTGARCATARRSPRPGGARRGALSVLRKSVGDAPITEAVEEGGAVAGGVPPAVGGGAGLRRPGRLLPDADLRGGRLARPGGGRAGGAVPRRRRRGDGGVREAGRALARRPAPRTLQRGRLSGGLPRHIMSKMLRVRP